MVNCPKCDKHDWIISAETHDTVIFAVDVHDDLTFDTVTTQKEYVGDTDYDDFVECDNCGYKMDLSTGKEYQEEEE